MPQRTGNASLTELLQSRRPRLVRVTRHVILQTERPLSSLVAQPGTSRYSKINWLTAAVLVVFHVLAVAALFQFSWTNLIVAAVPLLGRRRPRHQHGLPPAAHPPRVQDAEAVRVFPGDLRHADARRRPDLLGRHAPAAPSALRPAARPAHAARQRLLGAPGLDRLRRSAAQRHRASWRATRRTSAATGSTAG